MLRTAALPPIARMLAALLALALSASSARAADESWLAVPEPRWEGLEPAVAGQLRSLHDHVVARVSDSSVPAAQLAQLFGELGQHYHAYQLLELAAECYLSARRLAPDDFRWPYLLGYLQQSAGSLEAAVESYEQALAIFDRVPPALVRLAATYQALNRPQEAEAAFRRALALAPDSAAALAGFGQLLFEQGRHEDAIAALARALQLEPGATRLYYPLALAHRALGDLDTASELLAQRGEVGVRPADPLIDGLEALVTGERVHLIRGRAAFDAERYVEAAGEFRRAVESSPESVRARINLGAALERLGEVDAAIAELERAVALAPGNATALFNLGALYERRGDFEQALRRFADAASHEPRDAEIQLRLGDAQRRRGDVEEAVKSYGRAVAIDPASESAWVAEADALARLGRYDEALSRLETALRLIPASGQISHGLARLLAACPNPALRDGERALELALRVFEAMPTVGHSRTVAMALAQVGRCQEAAEWLGRAAGAARETGDGTSASSLEAERARYVAGPPCRPPAETHSLDPSEGR